MTKPTAVQLRELVDAFNAEADKYAERRWIDPRMPSEVAHAMGAAYRDSSKRLYALLAASEPAPEPQGGLVSVNVCKGTNCTAAKSNGHKHSSECLFEHARAIASGIASVDFGITVGDSVTCIEWRGHRIDLATVLTPKPSTPQDVPVSEFDFCWLVELFLPYGGNSLGYYHTGFTDLSGASRSTKDPLEARKYKTLKDAQYAASKLEAMQGEWRAVEHGFERVRHVKAASSTPQAESVPVVGGEESQ